MDIHYLQSHKLFSKLDHKTQMLKTHEGDTIIFENRLTHSKAVRSCCLTIVDKYNLNVDKNRLEFSALAHDIGHTPFGHAGEEAINDLFFSYDGLHLTEIFPGLFKHNINSIKNLINNNLISNDEDSAVVVDSILKHSSIFPKNYFHTGFKESNIIKMNYMFGKIEFTSTYFFKTFLEKHKNFPACKYKSSSIIKDREGLFSCRKSILCHSCESGNDLTSYLLYPFPLTTEGTVLYWSDEICCFCSDLFDFCKALIKQKIKGDDIKTLLTFSSLLSKIKWIESFYKNSYIISEIFNCFEIIENTNNVIFINDIDKINTKILNIKNNLISHLEIDDSIKKYGCNDLIVFDECKPIFSLDEESMFILKRIKDSIYKDVHRFKDVVEWNSKGENAIKEASKKFENNISYFSKMINRNESNMGLHTICDGLYNMLEINLISIKFDEFYKKIVSLLMANTYTIDSFLKSSYLNDIISKCATRKSCSTEYLMDSCRNLFRREISYFISRFSDDELEKIIYA